MNAITQTEQQNVVEKPSDLQLTLQQVQQQQTPSTRSHVQHYQPAMFVMGDSFCDIHHTQRVISGPGEVCIQCAHAFTEAEKRNAQRQVESSVREQLYASATIPMRYVNSGFKNYVVEHDGHQHALNEVLRFAQDVIAGKPRNLIMVGTTGVGKTHLACSCVRYILSKGKHARYVESSDLAQRMMDGWDKTNVGVTEKSVRRNFAEYDLLVLDEYGKNDRDKKKPLVHNVLYDRYDRMKSTFLVSNLTLEALKEDLGDRLWSRFQQDGVTVIECKWVDHRIKN